VSSTKTNYSETLITILTEMCERVGANYDEIDFKEDGWYHKYKWTNEEEEDFKKWMINYLYHHPERQRDILTGYAYYHRPKYNIKDYLRGFFFNYTWANKSKEEIVKEKKLKVIDRIIK